MFSNRNGWVARAPLLWVTEKLPSSSDNEFNLRYFLRHISINGGYVARGEHLKLPAPSRVRNFDTEYSVSKTRGARALGNGTAAGQWPRQQRTLSGWSVAQRACYYPLQVRGDRL